MMRKEDLIKRIVDNHNRIVQIEVHGDNAILVADTIRDLRSLLGQLQSELIEETSSKANSEKQ